MERVECSVTGKVQGVGFRWFTKIKADNYGITGAVRNLNDGSVFLVAEGERESLEHFLEHIKKGPRGARVENVEVWWRASTGEFVNFAIA